MKYAARRIAMLLVTMVVVSFLAFAAFAIIPASPAEMMLGTEATPEKVAALASGLLYRRPRYILQL